MEKTLSRPPEAVDDQQIVTLIRKISFTPTLERRAAETAMTMRIQRIW
jgi:hypothetical protein